MRRPAFLIPVVSGLLALFLTLSVQAGEGDGGRGEMLLGKVDAQATPAPSYETYFQIVNTLPNDKENAITAYSAKRQDGKAVVLIVSPPRLQGRTLLRQGNEVWVHIPGETQLRQSTLRHALVSGVFNNGDLLMTSFQADHRGVFLREDADSITLKLLPKDAETPETSIYPYRFAELTVDKESYLPIEMVQYAGNGVVIKTIRYDYQKKEGQSPLPTLSTAAEANPGYRSAIRVGNMKARAFPDAAFTKEQLSRVGSVLR